MSLAELPARAPETEAEPWTWADYLRTFDLSPELLATADRAAFRLLVARVDGEPATAALTLDCDGDCGIFNVGTVKRMPPRPRHRAHGTDPARRPRARVRDGDAAVDPGGGGRLRGRGLSRSRPDSGVWSAPRRELAAIAR